MIIFKKIEEDFDNNLYKIIKNEISHICKK